MGWSDRRALSWRVNGVSGAAVAVRLPRGVNVLREGVVGTSPFSVPRLGVRAARCRVPGVGVFKRSSAIRSCFGVVLGERESSKRWSSSSVSNVGGGGQFSLSGLSCSTTTGCTTVRSNQLVFFVSQGIHPSCPIPAFSHRPHGRSRSQALLSSLHRWQRGFLGASSSCACTGVATGPVAC